MNAKILTVMILSCLVIGTIPLVAGQGIDAQGYQGVSWKEVVPLKRAAFIGFNENSYLDDYSYLASIPVNAFYDEESDKMYSNPLLYYDPPRNEDTLNSHKGINTFMEDWMTYCGGELDQIQLINVDDSGIPTKWTTSSILEINLDDPFETASALALANWEHSTSAVVAAIEEDFTDIGITHDGTLKGEIPSNYRLETFQIRNSRDVGIIPQHNNFTISNQYKYVTANLTWRGGKALDPDLQLVDWDMGMVDASSHWSFSETFDSCRSYVMNHGDWSASVTYMPTKSTWSYTESLKERGSPRENVLTLLASLGKLLPFQGTLVNAVTKPKGVSYTIDVTLYPGTEIQLPPTPYGCRDAIFEIQSTANLGILIKDESGATYPLIKDKYTSIMELGEGNYTAVILKLDDSQGTIDFTLKYSWEQKFDRREGDALHSAAEGAILASLKNAPLLYVNATRVPSGTKKALETLNVDHIYFINLGNLSQDTVNEDLRGYGEISEYTNYQDLYAMIHDITHQDDIIFSTINPWSYWKAGTLQPAGEKRQGFYVGPGALMAAHHGSPLLITDIHPVLSRANAWHNNEWIKMAPIRYYPPVISMTLIGQDIYDFITDIGLNGIGQESMVTVAGQYDIGTTWDRVFPGAAYPGRIMGTPPDTAHWVCRSVFYPALIYANPAVNPDGVQRITGSESERRGGLLNIKSPEKEVQVMYPILESHVVYEHRFNELTFKRWGVHYETASGIIPFFDPSSHPIDDGSTEPYKEGQYYPDMSNSEVTSFYAQKLGYDSVFTTNFPATIENLNRGVLYWIEVMHGLHTDTGSIAFWKDTKNEANPWRGYEQGGSTENPDTLTFMKNVGLDIAPSSIVGNDGIVIAFVGQLQTGEVHGTEMIDVLDNVHSACFLGGSCLVSNTLLHLALIRSGFVYQVIDPWVTSWYSTFGFEMFMRELVFGATAGEAYGELIHHVGIEYMNQDYWWDTSENIEYFGDPDLVPFTPYTCWEKPPVYSTTDTINGHSFFVAEEHPDETPGFEAFLLLVILGLYVGLRKRKTQ